MPTPSRPFRKAIALFHPPLLAWPVWLRLIALAPLLLVLWLGVAWALMGTSS